MFKLILDDVIFPAFVLVSAFLFLLKDEFGGPVFYGGLMCSMATPMILGGLFVVRRIVSRGDDAGRKA